MWVVRRSIRCAPDRMANREAAQPRGGVVAVDMVGGGGRGGGGAAAAARVASSAAQTSADMGRPLRFVVTRRDPTLVRHVISRLD